MSNYILVKVSHQALDDHECLVSNCSTDGLSEVAAIEQDWGRRQNIWVEYIARISAPQYVLGRLGKRPDYVSDFLADTLQYSIRLIKSSSYMRALG